MSQTKKPARPIYLKVIQSPETLKDGTNQSDGETTKFGAQSSEQLDYMGALIQELKTMANELQEHRLAMLLDLAYRETTDQRPANSA
jgi:hypothetical protein